METAVQKVVRIVEMGRHCRITKACFDFVQDFNGKIWLLCCSEMFIVVAGADDKR